MYFILKARNGRAVSASVAAAKESGAG